MKTIERETIKMNENFKISIAKTDESTWEIAVLYNMFPKLTPQNWEIDYSIFPDPLKAHSAAEVYGTIKNIIQPAYYEITGWDQI